MLFNGHETTLQNVPRKTCQFRKLLNSHFDRKLETVLFFATDFPCKKFYLVKNSVKQQRKKPQKEPDYLKTKNICETIYEKVTYVGKQNFAPKICGVVENSDLQILMETCFTCIKQPCTVQIYTRRCVLITCVKEKLIQLRLIIKN